jgi:serine protease Do
MKTSIISHLGFSALFAAAVAARADDSKETPPPKPDGPPVRIVIKSDRDGDRVERAPVTFLGVETNPAGPALAAQLGLPADTGLVVVHVAEDSPAAAGLKRHDVLTKLNDQVLVDTRQLSVLIRSHKEGDEVTLTYYRGGKEQTVKVKLGRREMPKLLGLGEAGPGNEFSFGYFNNDNLQDLAHLRELPGPAREDVDNALRMIGREHGNWFKSPRVHVFSHGGGKGSTILNLADGNFVFSDEHGSVEVNAANGKRELTVKDAKGAVTFKGPINNDEDHQKLPPEVVARLDKIEKMDVGYEPGQDFEFDATAVPPPAKSKISAPSAAPHAAPVPSHPY